MTSIEKLREYFHYDGQTGLLYWKVARRGIRKGDMAGGFNHRGYYRIHVEGQYFSGSRLIWAIVTGDWPVNEIDHEDRLQYNNRFENLRDFTRKENMNNLGIRKTNTSGIPNIRETRNGTYEVSKNGKYLGRFKTLYTARKVLENANV